MAAVFSNLELRCRRICLCECVRRELDGTSLCGAVRTEMILHPGRLKHHHLHSNKHSVPAWLFFFDHLQCMVVDPGMPFRKAMQRYPSIPTCQLQELTSTQSRQSAMGAGPSPAQPPDGETSEGAQVLLHITTHDWEPRLAPRQALNLTMGFEQD